MNAAAIDCSQSSWMIEAGKLLGERGEIQLIKFEPNCSNYSFLQALGHSEPLEILIVDGTATIRRSS